MAVTSLAVEVPDTVRGTIISDDLGAVDHALGDLDQAGALGHHQLDRSGPTRRQNPDSPCRVRPSSAARVADR